MLVYSCPSKKALASITAKVKAITKQGTHQPLSNILRQLNLALRGWTTYFRHGASARTFNYLSLYTWRRVMRWLRRKHLHISWKEMLRRHLGNEWWPAEGGVTLFDPKSVSIVRYRYRGSAIPSPWDGRKTTNVR